MSYTKSVFDTVADAISPVMRRLNDIKLSLTGTKTNVMRVTSSQDNIFGDSTETYLSGLIANVEISYPFNNVDSLTGKDDSETDINALSITDLLPITMTIPFEGTQDSNFDRNDYIVDILKSSRGQAIPMILTGPKAVSSFYGKNEVLRVYELTLFRGELENGIEAMVDEYKTNIGVPSVSSSIPTNDETDVNTSGTIQLVFNTPMNIVEVEDALVTSFNSTKAWDNSGLILTLTPETYLTSGTVYTVSIPANTPVSEDGFAFSSTYSLSFTTVG